MFRLTCCAPFMYTFTNTVQVKPIVGNKAIESVDRPTYSALPFPTHTADSVSALPHAEIEAYLTTVYKSLQRSVVAAQSGSVVSSAVAGVLAERVSVLGYLYSIATSVEVSMLCAWYVWCIACVLRCCTPVERHHGNV